MAPRKGTATAAAPKSDVKDDIVEAPVDAGVDTVFTWEPKGGGDPIELPHGSRVVPKGKHFWFARKMSGLTFVGQVLFMFECAGVPKETEDRLFDTLDDDEILELVNAWSNDVNGASVGES